MLSIVKNINYLLFYRKDDFILQLRYIEIRYLKKMILPFKFICSEISIMLIRNINRNMIFSHTLNICY